MTNARWRAAWWFGGFGIAEWLCFGGRGHHHRFGWAAKACMFADRVRAVGAVALQEWRGTSAPDVPTESWWLRFPPALGLALLSLTLCGVVRAEAEEGHGGAWVWKAVTLSEGGGNDDVWGGRLAYTQPYGRVSASARVDFSGLKGEFDFDRPATYRSVEVYGALDYRLTKRMSVGLIYGGTRPFEDGAPGVGTRETWGVCGRVAIFGDGYLRACLGEHEAASAVDNDQIRGLLTAQIPVKGPLSVAVDGALTGPGRFVRIATAVRVLR